MTQFSGTPGRSRSSGWSRNRQARSSVFLKIRSSECLQSSVLYSDMQINPEDGSAHCFSHLGLSKLILLLPALAHTCVLPCFYKPLPRLGPQPSASSLLSQLPLTQEQFYSAPFHITPESRLVSTACVYVRRPEVKTGSG